MSGGFGGIQRKLGEFAGKQSRFPISATSIERANLHAVHVLLHMGSIAQNTDGVPLTHRLHNTFGRGIQSVIRARASQAIFAIVVRVVVQDLHLWSSVVRVVGVLAHVVHDAGISAFDNFPIQGEIEILKFIARYQVAARARANQATIAHGPTSWKRIFLETTEIFRGVATIKERDPAVA